MIAQHRVGKGFLGYVRADLKWAVVRVLIEYHKRVRLPSRELPTELRRPAPPASSKRAA